MRTPAAMETAARAGSRGEPRERAERILTTVLGALLGSVILGFVAIGSQLMSMHEAIGELRTEMHVEIGGLRDEMRTEMGKLSDRMTRIETFLQIRPGPLPGS